MLLNPNQLVLDIKLQDRFRRWFSTIGNENLLTAGCVILGDSDIDYELAPNVNSSRILDAPYQTEGIKYKLIYNGVGKNLAGAIKCFIRRVDVDGSIDSLYDYNADENFIPGQTPPTLVNGKDWDRITFQDVKMGYILFFETVLDYYLTDDGIKKRLVEPYTFSFDWNGSSLTPSNWDFVIDNTNGSLLLTKQDTSGSPIGLNYRGNLTVTGQTSRKIKIVNFNF